MMTERIGFIGIGNMGGAMAMRLLDAGFPLTVCDPNPVATAKLSECRAQVAATPRGVADTAEIVFASLPSLKVSREVAVGVEGIAKGRAIKVYVETSTLGTDTVNAIVEELRPTGIEYLDTTVAGEAKRLGTPVWLGSSILKMFQDAAAHGYKDLDSMHLIEYMEELAGVDVARRLGQRPRQPKQ